MGVLERMKAAYGGMSKAHQKIVHHYQSNPKDLIFDSLARFSQKAGSSEATVVRFANQLGYTGYSEMQKALQNEVLAGIFEPAARPCKGGGEAAGLFAPAIGVHEAALEQMYQELDVAALERACDVLMQAESVLVIGYMDAFGMGAQALHMLDEIRANVNFSRLLFETNEVFRHIHPHTAILGISFQRHYRFTYELLQLGREKGCDITLITDSPMNPLTLLANQVICTRPTRDEEIRLVDVSAPMHLLYVMVRQMALKYSEQVARYRESSLKRWEEFVE